MALTLFRSALLRWIIDIFEVASGVTVVARTVQHPEQMCVLKNRGGALGKKYGCLDYPRHHTSSGLSAASSRHYPLKPDTRHGLLHATDNNDNSNFHFHPCL